MSNIVAKPYLDWLDGNEDPPALLSLKGWAGAAAVLLGRMRAAHKRLASSEAKWSDFEDILLADRKFDSLNAWAEITHSRTPRLHRNSFKPTEYKLMAARRRVYHSLARSRAIYTLRGWVRRRNEPLASEQKNTVRGWIDYWKLSLEGSLKPEDERLEAKHFRRTRDYSTECQRRGLWLTRAQARDLTENQRKRARAEAKKLGQPGWFVAAHSELGGEIIGQLSDRIVREGLWRQRQQLRESETTILPMLEYRHNQATAEGHLSYAHYAMYSRAIHSPRKIMGILNDHLDKMRTANIQLNKRLMVEAQAWGLGEISPWDRPFLIQQITRRGRFHEEPVNAFNIKTMMEVAVPEIVSIGGWGVSSLTLHGEGLRSLWQFHLSKSDGQKAQIWIAAYNPKEDENLTIGAWQQLVRAPWNGGSPQAQPLSFIEMSVDHGRQFFDYGDMVYLCHELGHALHYLAQNNQHGGEDLTFPDDMIEFPSQLVERYAMDPHVLARWASHYGPAPSLAKRPAFWRYHLKNNLEGFDGHIRQCFAAWLDLMAHKTQADKVAFDELYRKGCERFGIAYHEEDKFHLRNFSWSSDYAANHYAYPLGVALCEEFLPRRENGTIDAQRLHVICSTLLDDVLTEGTDTKRFLRQWRRAHGEGVEDTAKRGMKRLTCLMRSVAASASNN